MDLALCTYMAGDFNFVTTSQDTTSYTKSRQLSAEALELWLQLLDKLCVQDAGGVDDPHTHFKICNQTAESHSSRFDRIYVPRSCALWTVFKLHIELIHHAHNSALYYDAFDKKMFVAPKHYGTGGTPVTDHLPVYVSFRKQERTRHVKAMPRWLAESPQFVVRFHYHWSRVRKGRGSFGRDQLFLKTLKRIPSKMSWRSKKLT